MKSLYLVGTTADNKRLVLAKTKGAKFGSFSVPITPKLKKIFQEIEEGRVENLKGGGKGSRAAAPAEEPAATEAEDSSAFEGITGLSRRGGSASRETGEGRGGRAGKKAKGAAPREEPEPQPEPEPEPEPEPAPVERRPPISSKFAPAQIQALLRQGKSARSVASDAGAPIEWVKRLMEPILLERMGIVEELKRATFNKARRGPSVVPVGLAIIDNLRERGVSFPERASARGWTAHRPEGREWRVRFTYDHRGATRTAHWEYDPPTRSVTPTNALASQLSWRPGPEALRDTAEPGREGGRPRARRQVRRPTRRKAAPKRSPAKRTTARKPVAKRSSGRKATAKRGPARKPAARKPAARKPAARKPAARKPAAKKASAKRAPAKRTTASRGGAKRSTSRR